MAGVLMIKGVLIFGFIKLLNYLDEKLYIVDSVKETFGILHTTTIPTTVTTRRPYYRRVDQGNVNEQHDREGFLRYHPGTNPNRKAHVKVVETKRKKDRPVHRKKDHEGPRKNNRYHGGDESHGNG